MRKTIVIIFGAPGSGKGFLVDCIENELVNRNIVSKENIGHISTGDLLRAEIAAQTPLGQEIAQIVSSGGLVSDEIVSQLFELSPCKGLYKVLGHTIYRHYIRKVNLCRCCR